MGNGGSKALVEQLPDFLMLDRWYTHHPQMSTIARLFRWCSPALPDNGCKLYHY